MRELLTRAHVPLGADATVRGLPPPRRRSLRSLPRRPPAYVLIAMGGSVRD